MILVPKLSLMVVGKLAPGTRIPECRPVHFHSSKVLLLVKFITRFISFLGLGQLEETFHQSYSLAFLILCFLVFKASRVVPSPDWGLCHASLEPSPRASTCHRRERTCQPPKTRVFESPRQFSLFWDVPVSCVSCDYCGSVVSFTVCSVFLWCFGGIFYSLTSLPWLICL